MTIIRAGRREKMGSFGTPELILILILVLVLFGGRKIPEIMRGLGEGLREFRKASDSATNEIKRLAEEPPADTSNDENKEV
ncbi:MAG: twin-arginine translocase TatA/TatE family subunit [Armatimonadetes bacterium]|nr:twin-arginine translocase TatA/TatE family subunit [Armatimonadota bacterium]